MNESEAQTLLEQTIQNNWAGTPIQFANTPPIKLGDASRVDLFDADEDFIQVSVEFTDTVTSTLGNTCVRIHGYLSIDINVKEGVGSSGATNYRVLLNNLLQYKTFGGFLRVKGVTSRGPYNVRQGWATYTHMWPFAIEDAPN